MVIEETDAMYLKRKYEEFENLDFWQLQKISELLQKALLTPSSDEQDTYSDLQTEIEDLTRELEDYEYEYNKLERQYEELENKYNTLKLEKGKED